MSTVIQSWDEIPPEERVAMLASAAAARAALAPSAIRAEMRRALLRYVAAGDLPGDFLCAVLAGDLFEACRRADSGNLLVLPAYAALLYHETPSLAYGSRGRVAVWSSHYGLAGRADGSPGRKLMGHRATCRECRTGECNDGRAMRAAVVRLAARAWRDGAAAYLLDPDDALREFPPVVTMTTDPDGPAVPSSVDRSPPTEGNAP